jgi:hypothetical protein
VSATIVRGDDFDVLDSAAAFTVFVLKPCIRQLDVSVLVRQLVFLGPPGDCLLTLFPRLSTLTTSPVLGLQEPLILALQLFLENHTMDAIASLSKTVRSSYVRAVDPGVVGQLAGLGNTDVERLTIANGAWPSTLFENRTALTRQRYEVGSRASHYIGCSAYQPEVAKAFEIAGRSRWSPRIGLPKVCRGHHAECANRRHDADVITRQSILPVVGTNAFSR